MMNAGSRSGFDQERAAPHAGADAQLAANGRMALRAGRLRRASAELLWTDHADISCLAHKHIF
jgi:hypothetical protein